MRNQKLLLSLVVGGVSAREAPCVWRATALCAASLAASRRRGEARPLMLCDWRCSARLARQTLVCWPECRAGRMLANWSSSTLADARMLRPLCAQVSEDLRRTDWQSSRAVAKPLACVSARTGFWACERNMHIARLASRGPPDVVGRSGNGRCRARAPAGPGPAKVVVVRARALDGSDLGAVHFRCGHGEVYRRKLAAKINKQHGHSWPLAHFPIASALPATKSQP